MTAPEYRSGEIVNITIRGVRINAGYEDGHISVRHPDVAGLDLWLAATHPAVRIARVVPADGEPQPGEVWADTAGATYFARLHPAAVPWVELLPSAGGPSVEWLVAHNGPSGPIERRWRPDPPPDPRCPDCGEPLALIESGATDHVPGNDCAQTPGHQQVAGWSGGAGECGAECACGTTFEGFDSIGAALLLLEEHIADPAEPGPPPVVDERAPDLPEPVDAHIDTTSLSPGARCVCDHRLSNHANDGRGGCRRCDPGACTGFRYAGAELNAVGGHERGRP